MKKQLRKLVLALLLSILFCQPAANLLPFSFVTEVEAHSGRTDSSGGHHDYKNVSGLGSYHFHCGGNPAHLHTGGVCPYSKKSSTSAKSTNNAKINKSSLTLIKGQSSTLSVTGTTAKVTWSSSKSSVASVQNGKITAKAKGTAVITAKAGSKTLTCKVVVETPSISKASAVLFVGQSMQLKISNTSQSVKWSTANKSVATVSNGKVTAKGKGTTTITASIGSKKYTCKVKVESPAISAKTLTLTEGNTAVLKVNGTTQKVTWKSSNSAVATINSSGKITARKAGTATITATVLNKGYTCKVTVKAKANTAAVFSSTAANSAISRQVVESEDSIAVILFSQYAIGTEVSGKCTFYDESGNVVDSEYDTVEFLEKDHKAILKFRKISDDCSGYQIEYAFSEGLKSVTHKSVVAKLSVSANYISDENQNYRLLTIKNENPYDVFEGEIGIIYYSANNEIVAVTTESIDYLAANGTVTRKSYVPYRSMTSEEILYSRCEVFVSWGYHLGN